MLTMAILSFFFGINLILPLMLLGNHGPTGIFPILRSLVYVRHQGTLGGIELKTFVL
jgi:hypothetical protein